MDATLLLPVILRWMHMLAAIVTVGGSFYILFVLAPLAGPTLGEEAAARLREALRKRWMMLVHASIALLIFSGFYNYLAITRFQHQGQALYHMLFGIKFLLALGVFFFAVALTSSSAALARIRANPLPWLRLQVILALAVVLLAGVMHTLPKTS